MQYTHSVLCYTSSSVAAQLAMKKGTSAIHLEIYSRPKASALIQGRLISMQVVEAFVEWCTIIMQFNRIYGNLMFGEWENRCNNVHYYTPVIDSVA